MTVYTGKSAFDRAKFARGTRIVYSGHGLSRVPGRVLGAPRNGTSKTYLVLLDGDTRSRRVDEAELDWETPRETIVRSQEN